MEEMKSNLIKKLVNMHLASGGTLPYLVRNIQEEMAHQAMIKNGGNLTRASEMIGVTRETMSRYVGMTVPEWKKKYMK